VRTCLSRRSFGKNPLQRPPVHAKTARGLRYVSTTYFVDVLDVLPAHTIRRQRMPWWFCLTAHRRKQSRDDVVGVRRFGEIVDGAELHCADCGSNIAVARLNDSACIGTLLLERRNDVQTASVVKSQIHHGKSGCAELNLCYPLGDRFSSCHSKATRLHRLRQALPQRFVVLDDQNSAGERWLCRGR
jgi:hypothetical protein